jgi:hypothetical protein
MRIRDPDRKYSDPGWENNADLYCTALDMITALIHSTLVIDREEGGEFDQCLRIRYPVQSFLTPGSGIRDG